MVYVLEERILPVDSDPETGLVPDQLPEATQEVAFVEIQDKVAEALYGLVMGPLELLIKSLTVGVLVTIVFWFLSAVWEGDLMSAGCVFVAFDDVVVVVNIGHEEKSQFGKTRLT